MEFVCSDEEFISAIESCSNDNEKVAKFVSELYGKAVHTIHTDSIITSSDSTQERELTISSAYLGCIMLIFRQALEVDGDARKFYGLVEGVCPYCVNVNAALLGMKLDEEVSSLIRRSIQIATGTTNITTEAIVYVARHASLTLVTAHLLDNPVQCIGDNPSCGKTILELLEMGLEQEEEGEG